jgi:para-aminobenzoate synthetase component 1
MKGTINAHIPHAEELILNDPKEKAEHATIVDLIRNDLSLVASQVDVKRYRYIEKLSTNKQDLLQVSSEIRGLLPADYYPQLGNILASLLPAGSISGAPKAKTIEIIKQAEMYDRGYYTGICGYYDGINLDSTVMIRYIEQTNNQLIFKSGGGITAQSSLENEYQELIQKVYVPIY